MFSLRTRVFLFFCLMAASGMAILWGALWLGASRNPDDLQGAMVLAGISGSFALVAITAAVWLLFDEIVVKPIQRLAASMRTRAHTGVEVEVDTHSARFLGDLAPAVHAVSKRISDSAMDTARAVASETARLAEEKARLTALLTEIPVATVLANAANQIVLYDGQAAEVLAQGGVPRLNAPLFDYFDEQSLRAGLGRMHKTGMDQRFKLQGLEQGLEFDAVLKPLDAGGYMLLIEGETLRTAPDATRPLVYDFELLSHQPTGDLASTPLRSLVYTVFDTETTGLLPHKDEIVQIGAVRIVNGRMVAGEEINQLVNPGIPIPASTTQVHGISDRMVADAPDIVRAAGRFHHFARGSVIVAHNAPFDMAFLRRHAERCQLTWDHPILDTVLLSAVLFGASETHTLDALCARLGIEIPAKHRHTALGDAIATADALVKMLPMLEGHGMRTFGDVIEETRRHGRLLQDLN
ncbi:exonuclease domain-containing protein [Primorskyibacter sedentarius]|uniref:3'-5' exonuclease n=1 Tax=Primorskyibacter sedentarius TaxID=745311 RepID=UPI003EBEE762